MRTLVKQLRRFLRDENGPTSVEYAIMIAFIVLVSIAAIQTVGSRTNTIYQDIEAKLP